MPTPRDREAPDLDERKPSQVEYDDTVAELTARAERADGWLVYDLWIDNEGGGTVRWWLEPCDQVGGPRRATMTEHRQSDTDPGLDSYDVAKLTIDCVPPGRRIEVASRTLTFDVDLMLLWEQVGESGIPSQRVWAVDGEPEQITVTDSADGHQYTLSGGTGTTAGACDGANFWTLETVYGPYFRVRSRPCVDEP